MQNHIYCFRNTCKDFINSVQRFEGSSVEKKVITILDKWPKTFQKELFQVKIMEIIRPGKSTSSHCVLNI